MTCSWLVLVQNNRERFAIFFCLGYCIIYGAVRCCLIFHFVCRQSIVFKMKPDRRRTARGHYKSLLHQNRIRGHVTTVRNSILVRYVLIVTNSRMVRPYVARCGTCTAFDEQPADPRAINIDPWHGTSVRKLTNAVWEPFFCELTVWKISSEKYDDRIDYITVGRGEIEKALSYISYGTHLYVDWVHTSLVR